MPGAGREGHEESPLKMKGSGIWELLFLLASPHYPIPVGKGRFPWMDSCGVPVPGKAGPISAAEREVWSWGNGLVWEWGPFSI